MDQVQECRQPQHLMLRLHEILSTVLKCLTTKSPMVCQVRRGQSWEALHNIPCLMVVQILYQRCQKEVLQVLLLHLIMDLFIHQNELVCFLPRLKLNIYQERNHHVGITRLSMKRFMLSRRIPLHPWITAPVKHPTQWKIWCSSKKKTDSNIVSLNKHLSTFNTLIFK